MKRSLKHSTMTELTRMFPPKRTSLKITKIYETKTISAGLDDRICLGLLWARNKQSALLHLLELSRISRLKKREYFKPWIAGADFFEQVGLWSGQVKLHITETCPGDKWIEKKVFCHLELIITLWNSLPCQYTHMGTTNKWL